MACCRHILGTQDTRLARLASDEELWRPFATKRWSTCDVAAYGGSYRRMYCRRVSLPTPFLSGVDRCHSLTAAARGQQQQRRDDNADASATAAPPALPRVLASCLTSPDEALNCIMMAAFSVGLVAASFPFLTSSPEYQLHRADLLWWYVAALILCPLCTLVPTSWCPHGAGGPLMASARPATASRLTP